MNAFNPTPRRLARGLQCSRAYPPSISHRYVCLFLVTLALQGTGAPPASAGTAPSGQQSAFGIDYSHPEQYVAPGRQTLLTRAELAELAPDVLPSLNRRAAGIEQLAGVYKWLRSDFETWSGGGSTIGAITARELIQGKQLSGCHDFALVFAAGARVLGYPAVLVDAAGLEWARSATFGGKGRYVGHVFVEVFIEGRWILVDPTNGPYVASGYDPQNPVIPLGKGYYVMRKGADTWGYGITSNRQLQQLMDDTAMKLRGVAVALPSYDVQSWRAPTGPPSARQPAATPEMPCRGKPERYANGRIKSGVLAREYSIGGAKLPEGTSISFTRDGSPEECTLGGAATLRGYVFPAGTRVKFGPQGRPFHCRLPQDLVFCGVPLPAKSEVFFSNPYFEDPKGENQPQTWRCWFPTKTRVQGHLCGATTDGVGQIFYTSGQLRALWLQENEEIDGVPCSSKTLGLPLRVLTYGTDRMACFYPNGRLQQAMVARDCTIQGQNFKAGDIIRLTPEGALDPIPTTLRGKNRFAR